MKRVACQLIAAGLLGVCPLLAADLDRSIDDELIAFDSFEYSLGMLDQADQGRGWKQPWRLSRVTAPTISEQSGGAASESTGATDRRSLNIRGTGNRNNPLRRQLTDPLSQRELFVRFQLHYVAGRIDENSVDPEFFVLWLDRLDGGDRSTHANRVPNIGIHLADRGPKKGKNVFMVRIGSAYTAWSNIELQHNRTYQVVGRLSKSKSSLRADYDRFDLWVDPALDDLDNPDATIAGVTSMPQVKWIGFSTGLKTEASDQIEVGELVLGSSWQSVLDESAAVRIAASDQPGHNGVVWEQTVDFKRDVYPLLRSQCFDCHAGDSPAAGHRLDVYDELLGYSTGEVLAEPGRSRTSRLIQAVAADSPDQRMPPDGADPLSDKQIAMLKAWIDQGMRWDDQLLPPPLIESDHWAFQPITRPAVPAVDDGRWSRTPIDAFVARKHLEAGLHPAEQADRRSLVRRLYLDLIGLPPTPSETEQFLTDQSPMAYENLVERLLASPHYGERWGRYWLDLARWAESQGYQHDIVRPYAWRYRDYVIDSFNQDKSYDRFIKEQLAGDELQPYSDENLIATGFLGAARISGNQEDEAIQRNDVLVDIVNATSSVMLGLTIECAQCHNHKFDPISQRDYYRLQGFFVNGQLGNLSLRDPQTPNPTELKDWIPTASYNFYNKEVNTLVKKKWFTPTQQPHTWGYHSPSTSDSAIERLGVVNRKPIAFDPAYLKNARPRLLRRGDAGSPGPVVGTGWPEVLGSTPSSLGDHPRSALADWMAARGNPLVSRVWVNRIWQFHFGRGLVPTPSDFGIEGAAPTHPELLDWLASELIDSGWSTKHIHRQIVASSVYRQQAKVSTANAEIDPDNRLLWRWPRRRLEAEVIRDSVLVTSNQLDRSIGGTSIPPEREEHTLRRTIYLFQQRSSMPSVMEMFDAPTGVASCSRRAVSTVALQPLFMLNSEFMAQRASALAQSVRDSAGHDHARLIEIAFQKTLCRSPDSEEAALAARILSRDGADDGRALEQLCHALLNLNEFVYLP